MSEHRISFRLTKEEYTIFLDCKALLQKQFPHMNITARGMFMHGIDALKRMHVFSDEEEEESDEKRGDEV